MDKSIQKLIKTTFKHLLNSISLIAIGLSAPLLSQELIDPTKPLSYKTKNSKRSPKTSSSSSSLPNLNAIIQSKEQNSAIINNQHLVVGQWVSGYKLLKIDSNSVVIKNKNKRHRLYLFPEVSQSVSE